MWRQLLWAKLKFVSFGKKKERLDLEGQLSVSEIKEIMTKKLNFKSLTAFLLFSMTACSKLIAYIFAPDVESAQVPCDSKWYMEKLTWAFGCNLIISVELVIVSRPFHWT